MAEPSIHLTKLGNPRRFWGGKRGRKCPPKLRLHEVPCLRCEMLFIPTRRWQKFCGKLCRDKHHDRPWGHARQRNDESSADFKKRVMKYNRTKLRNWAMKNVKAGLCRSCRKPVVGIQKCWCERHWLQHMVYRSGLGSHKDAIDRVKRLLERQNFECPYTGKKLVIGVNASIDHKNPISRFPDQKSLWENVEWVDVEVNRAKRSLTKEEFLAVCRLVAERHPDH